MPRRRLDQAPSAVAMAHDPFEPLSQTSSTRWFYKFVCIHMASQQLYLPAPLGKMRGPCLGGEIGRRAGFKIRFLHGSVGSSPTPGTTTLERIAIRPSCDA